MQEKAFVEGIYNESLRKDRISKGLANTLNILTKTVFGEANRFVFELLQNADDAPKAKGTAEVEVEFVLLKEYLIFRHNGAHFTPADVNGISDIGSRESEKDKDIDKTGYKGIGFKSVFGTSDCVHIVSNNFSFRFDRNYELWKDSQDHPWQIVPIWTEKLPDEVIPYIKKDYVNTIISVSNRAKVATEINAVFQDCQIALFLRHIKSISFLDEQRLMFKIEKRQSANGLRGLFKNNQLLSHWITKDFVIDIKDDLREKLNLLSKEECPDKLKNATHTKITFAALISDDEIHPVQGSFLYCYLPTKVKKGFPFIANADFITNAERTQFLENDWNTFLFHNIATKQIEWCAELQKTPFKYQVTRLLRGNFQSYPLPPSEKVYNDSFQIALAQIPFLPEQKGVDLVRLKDGLVDVTGFCESFGTAPIKTYLNTNSKVVDLRIQFPNRLIELGAASFSIEKLSDLLTGNMESLVHGTIQETNKKLITFLFEKTTDNQNHDWQEHLKKTKFLLDEHGEYKTPKETYFPLTDGKKEAVDFLSLNSLDNNVFLHFSENREVLSWLHSVGVKEPSPLEIVRKSVVKMIEENKITEANSLSITRFIFQVFKGGKFSDQDYQHLSKLKLITSGGFQATNNSYLADEYLPELPIRAILPTANFVSKDYPQLEAERPQWKLFFTKIGVKEKISIYLDSTSVERTFFIKQHPNTKEYFNWLDDEEHYPSLYEGWKNSGQHGITNFTFVDYIEKLDVHSYSKSFWKSNLNNWDSFISKCNQTTYYYRGGNSHVPSFIQYYIQHHPSIPATDGKCYPSKQVYTSHLKNIVGKYFPVADFEKNITKEQAEFLGFKWNISFTDSFAILQKLVGGSVTAESYDQISAVYDQLIKISKDLSSQEVKEISVWRKTGKLLALNNTFQDIDKLSCFVVAGVSPPANSEHFIKMPSSFSYDDIKTFCNLFDIPVVTFEKLEFAPNKAIVESKLHSVLTAKAKYFCLIYAHQKSEQPDKIIQRANKKIAETTFYTAECLSLVFKRADDDEIYNTKLESWFNTAKEFYYVGNWNSPLTLYSLSTTICTFLELKGIERELELILKLSEKEIQTWLTGKGYKHNFEPVAEAPQEPEQPTVVAEPEIIISFEEFKPDVKAADVKLENVETETKITGEKQSTVSPPHSEIKDAQTRFDVGRWSEEFMYKYLKNEFGDGAKVNWENENGETGKPYDFKVEENGVERFIEVKGTPSEDKQVVYLSDNEWNLMFSKGENYFIYRLFNAGKGNLKIKIIPNPSQLIAKGELLPNPITLQL